ncbi:MAG TPA: CRTAC1 family protein [Planctomycetota bacterium]|nr:CRTAC1 family protein [Planctomycetota bacterium]
MVTLLDQRAEQAREDNPYFGERAVRELRGDLQRLGDAAPWRLRLDTAVGELQLGHERAAIELLAAAREGLRKGILPGDTAAAIGVSFHLGVAWLRLGETENCCASPTPETCILPIAGTGRHRRTEGAENAILYFDEVLRNTPPTDYWHHAALWLTNLAHMTLGTYPDGVPEQDRLPERCFAPEVAFPRFHNIAADVGLDTFATAGGVAVDDFDGDEYLDVIVSEWAPRGQLRFFKNQRDGTFVDRTEAAGLIGITGGLNLVHADYDNDGDLDVLVLRGGWWFDSGKLPVSLLQNRGDGTFLDVTFDAGLGRRQLPTQTAAFADYDLDGDLDLYIGSESSQRVPCACQLYRNNGDGTFTDVANAAGVTNDAYAKGVAWGDYDNDRWPDLYVSNIDGKNRLYRNRGDGTFTDVAELAGVTGPATSFPAWFFDFDNDGALDLFVANYNTGVAHIASYLLGRPLPFEKLRLYRGDGRGGFRDVAPEFGLDYPMMPMGCNFGDLDNDGWLDFYLGTGDPQFASLMPNLMYHNRAGAGFESVTMAGGFGHLQKGHGVAFADLDNDGDQDVFEVVGGAYPGDAAHNVLFENPGFGNHWLTLRLVGTASARCAIGARIAVTIRENGASRAVHRHVGTGSSFGGNPLRQTIGLGKAERIERVEIFWPKTGVTQVVDGVPLDATIRVVEASAGFTPIAIARTPFHRR